MIAAGACNSRLFTFMRTARAPAATIVASARTWTAWPAAVSRCATPSGNRLARSVDGNSMSLPPFAPSNATRSKCKPLLGHSRAVAFYRHKRDGASCLDIGPEQNMLTVVEWQAIADDTARAPAKRRRHFIKCDGIAFFRESECSGATGPAASD